MPSVNCKISWALKRKKCPDWFWPSGLDPSPPENILVSCMQNCMRHAMIPKYILTPNLGLLPQIIYRYALGSTLIELKPEVKVTVILKQLVTRKGHTKYETATISNIGVLLWVHFSRTDSWDQGCSGWKQWATFYDPNIYPQIEFES